VREREHVCELVSVRERKKEGEIENVANQIKLSISCVVISP
jgi:hypothetical protein